MLPHPASPISNPTSQIPHPTSPPPSRLLHIHQTAACLITALQGLHLLGCPLLVALGNLLYRRVAALADQGGPVALSHAERQAERELARHHGNELVIERVDHWQKEHDTGPGDLARDCFEIGYRTGIDAVGPQVTELLDHGLRPFLEDLTRA